MHHHSRTWNLTGVDRKCYESSVPGTLGGHRRSRIYGRLGCPAALRAIARGGYVQHRVFFADEPTAIAAGYRPCAVCLPECYRAWKAESMRTKGATTMVLQLQTEPNALPRTSNPRANRVLDQLDAAWADFHNAYAGLTDEQLLTSGVTGDWSIRDLIAHVTWWDQESIDHLPITLVRGRLPRYSQQYGGIDAFNAMKTRERASLTLIEVQELARATHQRLLDYLLDLDPESWVGNNRFRHRLKLDTWSHYPIHAADIRAWRRANGHLSISNSGN